MKIKLNKLIIENFKGISKLEINPNGENIEIEAQNGKGKSSVCDAFANYHFNFRLSSIFLVQLFS